MRRSDAWTRVVIMRNQPTVPASDSDVPWGFKFLVLGVSGQPEWFGRCGWANTSTMERECRLVHLITHDQDASQFSPESRCLPDGPSTIQVCRYLGNVSYDRYLGMKSAEQWEADLDSIIASSEKLLSRLNVIVQDLRRHQHTLGYDFDRLIQSGIDRDVVGRTMRHLEAVEDLPSVLQHGDLWPANVLAVNGAWNFIDFTECGLVWRPGYDLFHLLNYSPDGFSTSWIAPDSATVDSRMNAARLRVIKRFANRSGFSSQAMGVLALYFVVHILAYRLRPGVSDELRTYWISELYRLDRVLRSGLSVAELLPGLDNGV